jgi:hypothetical protein
MDRSPDIDDLELFVHQFRTWYAEIQPTWRGRTWPLVKNAPAHEKWLSLIRGGRNGLLNLVVSFVWWWQAVNDEDDIAIFDDTLEDFSWVLQQLLSVAAK